MPLPAKSEPLVCEQCGAPLLNLPGEEGCLNCLLSTGIKTETEQAGVLPNESVARAYQHYEILTHSDGALWELGRGAMGITYKARHVSLANTVALKVINARFSARPEARQRFLREAQAAAQLRHPNVASVFHFGVIEQTSASGKPASGEKYSSAGDCFYAMEFIEGESLETRLRRAGPLRPALALEIALQVARALSAAEKRGLVHRDLKPSNIMLVADEEPAGAWVKVIDFGVAKPVASAVSPEFGGDESASASGRFLGTRAFSSPEQREAREVDSRSDTYSLGATLWYALTGKLPGARLANAPLPVAQLLERNVPVALVGLLQSMLALDPRDRPRSAIHVTDALERNLESMTAPRSRRDRARRWALAAGLALLVGLAGLAIYVTTSSVRTDDKSIAVLPFRNLSSDPANALFAEGVQEDIGSRLARIRDLKVISRPGTARYPATAPRDLRAIGQALGVRHVVEGSLRRSGDRVLLHVSLIDVSDGHEIWSEGYDRRLVDAINLQGELASDIADALDARISPHERVDVRASSTHNPDAYVLYLRGRKLENSPTFQISNYEAAQVLYSQAVALDPGFALAHARLASALGLLYRYRGPGDELKERAYREVRDALRLQPGLGEAHLAKALCDYRIERDFDRALPELAIARRLLPNDTEPDGMIALIRRRQGLWREARAALERARARDPLNRRYEQDLNATACLLRDWPAAALHGDRAASIPPVIQPLKVERALVDVWQNGNLAPLQKALAAIASYPDAEGALTWERWDTAMLARDFAAAQAAVDRFPFETLPSVVGAPIPKSYFEGCIYLARGEEAEAQKFFELVRPAMEAESVAHPEDALRHARLGLLYAYMGRKADAVREGEHAAHLTPVTADALDGHQWQCNLALIYARIGDGYRAISMIESLLRAISMIESLLRQPGCVSPLNEEALTLWDLRLRWQWDPLRKDLRFQKILAGPEPATIF